MEGAYVLDRMRVRGGQLGEVKARLRDAYLPGARARGMQLVSSWVSPPVEIAQGNELFVLWSLGDAEGFWQMRTQAGDPAIAAFWASLEPLVEERERRFLAAEELA